MPMLQTAEFVANKHGISREQQDEYALESQIRTARAQKQVCLTLKSFLFLPLKRL